SLASLQGSIARGPTPSCRRMVGIAAWLLFAVRKVASWRRLGFQHFWFGKEKPSRKRTRAAYAWAGSGEERSPQTRSHFQSCAMGSLSELGVDSQAASWSGRKRP